MALLRDDSSGLPNHRHRSGHRLGTVGLHLLPARLEIVVLACDAVVVIVKVIVYQIVGVGIVFVFIQPRLSLLLRLEICAVFVAREGRRRR